MQKHEGSTMAWFEDFNLGSEGSGRLQKGIVSRFGGYFKHATPDKIFYKVSRHAAVMVALMLRRGQALSRRVK